MIDLLILFLRPALLCVEAKQYRYALHALVAWLVDLVIAHTTWAAMNGWPERGEWTVSHTLERLCATPGVRQQLFVEIAKEINRNSPTGRHIKAVVDF